MAKIFYFVEINWCMCCNYSTCHCQPADNGKKNVIHKIFFTLKEKDSGNEWKILNADQSVEELHEQIIKVSLKLIEECNQLPLRDLWKEA